MNGRRSAPTQRDRGVRLFGDIPIYVSQGGADHIAHPQLFRHGEVAGVPPDAFARTGQLWGNPLYDWSAMRADDYRWWIERLRRMFELVDLTRIDHFRGFVSYWAVPSKNKTAVKGRWLRGPGLDLFEALEAALGDLPVVAEDLGVITEPVVRLRRALGLPGMVVLQFALGDDPTNPHLPRNHEQQSVVYTGTHDNDTTQGWFDSLSPQEQAWTELDPAHPAWSLIEVAWSSRAALAIAPLQDVLELGTEARMNLPGRRRATGSGASTPDALTAENARRAPRALAAARNRELVPGEGLEPPCPYRTAGFKPAASDQFRHPGTGARGKPTVSLRGPPFPFARLAPSIVASRRPSRAPAAIGSRSLIAPRHNRSLPKPGFARREVQHGRAGGDPGRGVRGKPVVPS